jgi:hypothetical protein
MAKHLHVTIREHTFDTYLSGTTENLSAYVDKLICIGGDSLENPESIKKARLLELIQKNQSLEADLKKLQLIVDNYKAKFNKKLSDAGVDTEEELKKKEDDMLAKENMTKSLQASGILSR